MKKKTKVISIAIVCIFIMASLLMCMVGCVTKEQQCRVSVDNLKWDIRPDKDINFASKIVDSQSHLSDLDVDKVYLMKIEFSITSKEKNNGTLQFGVKIDTTNINTMSSQIESADTSAVTELDWKDSNGIAGKTAKASFTISEKKDGVLTKTIVLKFVPIKVGDVTIKVGFEGNKNVIIRGNDMDGFTKNFEIIQVQLASPEIEYNENNMILSWQHVANATAYDIYIDDVLKKTIIAENEQIGRNLYVHISEICTNGNYRVSLVAKNDKSTNFIPSSKSNTIYISIR